MEASYGDGLGHRRLRRALAGKSSQCHMLLVYTGASGFAMGECHISSGERNI